MVHETGFAISGGTATTLRSDAIGAYGCKVERSLQILTELTIEVGLRKSRPASRTVMNADFLIGLLI